MKILILDMTHGGDILAEEYIAKGHAVACADVYGIASDEKKRELAAKGATVLSRVTGTYDTAVLPAHCPDVFLGDAVYGERITFSRAVKDLIDDRRFRIEVTGVKGKTSTCYLLAHILSQAGRKVFLHTSRGQGPWIGGAHAIEKRMSIAPPSLLRLPKGDFNCMISEVSLGGSGKADIAVITNLAEDYGIAAGTRKASDAKSDILTGGINIVREDEAALWKKYGYGIRGCAGSVRTVGTPELGKPTEISFEYGGPCRTTLDPGYLALQYLPAIDTALCVCVSMDIGRDAVIRGLRTFKGVPGRGEVSFRSGVRYVTDRNPGVSALSVRVTLGCLKAMNALDNAWVTVDPVNRKVCEKMNADEIRRTAAEFGVSVNFTDGDAVQKMPEGTRTAVMFVKEGFQ